ncbi:S66 peptidase family protein [Mucilaginibacter sp.]
MSITPPYLQKGHKVAITCPAKRLPKPMDDAVALLQSWELEVVLGDTIEASWHQFAGDDALRAADMQRFVNDDSIKAIFAARGGYGTIRMVDRVNFNALQSHPKWFIGFSDITVLHAHLHANYNLQTLHGQMPVNITEGSAASLETLRQALFGEAVSYQFAPHPLNRTGHAEGPVVGGNLMMLISMLGSVSDYSYDGKILFIEDVGEYLYAIDRMLYILKRAGKLAKLAGLMVGAFTDLKDNDIPFGQTVPEMVMNVVQEYNYPVCFDFPAGHIPDNQTLIFGRQLQLEVAADAIKVHYR